MYLHELKIWNFRKYGINGDDFATAEPGVTVEFQDGVNVLIGENNSGKTTIVDAIRLVLKTQSQDFFQVEEKDFFQKEASPYIATDLKIECIFRGFSHHDAAHFLEWIGFDNEDNEEQQEQEYILKVWLYAKRKDNSVIQYTKAGLDSEGTYLEGEARELLKVVYLKPLRDALSEMTHGYKSRLAQILKSHPIFRIEKDEEGKDKKHKLEIAYQGAKKEVDEYFTLDDKGKSITEAIKGFLSKFLLKTDKKDAVIQLTGTELTDILRQLDLVLEENKSGLGSLNLLFIAAELLLHQEYKQGLKLTLIEELEAHLHPQYQLRLIDFIAKQNKEYGQFILTTHSTTLASQIKLNNLIICQGNSVYPMKEGDTKLAPGDYRFLERFLDTTKANLFFARGVIFVEGESENILISTIADLIDRPLNDHGVSVVNVGSKAYSRYARIFIRKQEPKFNIKVAIISDLDIPALEYYKEEPLSTIIKIDDSFLDRVKCISKQNVKWDNPPEYFFSKNDFKSFIIANKTVKKFPPDNPSIMERLMSFFESYNKAVLSESILSELREKRKKEEQKKWEEFENIKLFLTENWTLEYEIARSKIYKNLIEAFRIALFEKNNEDIPIDSDTYNVYKEEINTDYLEENLSLQDAYEIFSPINKGVVSKVAVAQHLSELLLMEEDRENLSSIIKTDPYLKYIVDAIYHVTEAPTEE